jgi:hypothetical protein
MGIGIVALFLMGISIMLFSSSDLVYAEIEDFNEIKINETLTRPTFGTSHEDGNTVVDNGFKFNGKTFFINDNFHTPFEEQTINIGKANSFEVTTYAEKGLKVQEFLFGVPRVGDAHLAELGVEVWYGYDGKIQNIKTVQRSKVIDEDHVIVKHEKTKCKESDVEANCDTTKVLMVFLEPLKDKVMALKAIDYKNRYQLTYLNDGFDIEGQSLNPMKSAIISSPIKGEGPLKVVQTEKYSRFWETSDGRIFERNNFGSFKQIIHSFERFNDSGEPRTRVHSGFGGILDHEKNKAMEVFDSSLLISELPETFAYVFPEPEDRLNEEVKQKMKQEEELAQSILEKIDRQTRQY